MCSQGSWRLVVEAGPLLLRVLARHLGHLRSASQERPVHFSIRRRQCLSCNNPLRKLGLPLILSTIYNGCFPNADYQRLASTALMVFNDVILRVGIEYGLSIIDLRFVCSSPNDYANPIEPSSHGGAKIARCILAAVEQAGKPVARVITGSVGAAGCCR